MIWQSRLCSSSFASRKQIFSHSGLQHSHYPRASPPPCLYADWICTFQTLKALRTHLSRYHPAQLSRVRGLFYLNGFYEHFCSSFLNEPFPVISESIWKTVKQWHAHMMIVAITQTLKSSFNSHKSREHQTSLASDFQTDPVSKDPHDQARISEWTGDFLEECPDQSTEVGMRISVTQFKKST